jgi:hypothetical protein
MVNNDLPPVPDIPVPALFVVALPDDGSWRLVNSMFELRQDDCSFRMILAHSENNLMSASFTPFDTWPYILRKMIPVWESLRGIPGLRVFGKANLIQPMMRDARARGFLACEPPLFDVLDTHWPSLCPEAQDRRRFDHDFCGWIAGEQYSVDIQDAVRFIMSL